VASSKDITMRTPLKLLLAGLIATLLMSLLVSSASANRMSLGIHA
jgi:hypothetical protein